MLDPGGPPRSGATRNDAEHRSVSRRPASTSSPGASTTRVLPRLGREERLDLTRATRAFIATTLATLSFSCAPVNDRVNERSESGRRSSPEETTTAVGAARPGGAASVKAAPPTTPTPPPTPHLTEASAGRAVLESIEVTPAAHPLAQLDDSALAQLIRTRTPELGSVSLGRPNRGGLFNGVQMPEHQLWHLEEPENAWGTRETIDSIRHAIERVESDLSLIHI